MGLTINRQDILPRSTSLKEGKSEEGNISNQKRIFHHSYHDTKTRNMTASSPLLGHNKKTTKVYDQPKLTFEITGNLNRSLIVRSRLFVVDVCYSPKRTDNKPKQSRKDQSLSKKTVSIVAKTKIKEGRR